MLILNNLESRGYQLTTADVGGSSSMSTQNLTVNSVLDGSEFECALKLCV